MSAAECRHKWAMVNRRSGYLVVEGCFHCGGRISYFSEEPSPPRDDYREGDHFWSSMGDFQAMKFDLQCELCGELTMLDDVMALMLCMACDPRCGVHQLAEREPGVRTWPYVALCADTSHVRDVCISPEGIRVLNQYFNAGLRDANKRIVVAPCSLRRSADSCQGVVLADVGLTAIY